MVREIIRPTQEVYPLRIPHEYMNRQVEILVFPLKDAEVKQSSPESKPRRSLAGALSRYADPSLMEQEKEIAWGKVAEEHNGIS